MGFLAKAKALKAARQNDSLKSFRKELERRLNTFKYIYSKCPPMKYASLELEGRKMWLLGSTPRHFQSSGDILNQLDKINPSAVCVTDLHPTSSFEYSHFASDLAFKNPGLPYQDSDLMVKGKFFDFFEKHYTKNLYYFHNDSGTFFMADPSTKTCVNDDALSVANWTYLDENSGLVAAGAHPFMIHEDLIHSISLKRMREVFHLSVEEFQRRSKSLGETPLTRPLELLRKLTNIIKSEYIEEFYLKRTQYSASVVQKVSKSFKRTAIVHYGFHINLFEKLLYSQLEDYQEILKSKYFDGTIDELIEKIVILSHIDSNYIRKWLEGGHDPLQHMFKGQFNYPVNELKAAFDYYNEYYKKVLTNTLEKDIHRIEFYSERGRQVESFEKTKKKIEGCSSKFIIGRYQNKYLQKIKFDLISKQIIQNVKQRIHLGTIQNDEIMALEQISKGDYNSFNFNVIMKLLAEANSQLKIMKLPPQFRKFEDQIYTKLSLEQFYTQMKEFKFPEFKKNSEPIQIDKDGKQFMIVGPGDMPAELKGKSIEEINKLGVETIFESPFDHYNKRPIPLRQKELRECLSHAEDILGK